MTDAEIQAVELSVLLRRLSGMGTGYLRAGELKPLLTPQQYAEYRASLGNNRQARRHHAAPALSAPAQAYWDGVRALCERRNITRGKAARSRLVDGAADLLEQYEGLAASDKGRFRAVDASAGDSRWAAALHDLEHDLPLLDERASQPLHLSHVEHHTQRQFLLDLIQQLDPEEPHTVPVAGVAQARQLRGLAQRLAR